MNSIPQIIKQAFIENQSFKIEDLGYFTVNYVPAEIHPILHSFTPPKYQIVFSQEPIPTTSSFDKYVARKLAITSEEAILKIRKFTNHILQTIKEEKTCIIDDFGEFSMQDDQLIFSAYEIAELNKEFVGLDTFKMPIVEKAKKKVEKAKNTSSQKPKKSHKKLIWCIIIILILGGSITLGYYYRDCLKTQWEKVSIKLIKNNEEVVLKSEDTIHNEPIIQESENIVEDTVIQNSISQTTSEVTSQSSQIKYYLIAGCFKSEKNAKKLMKELENKGFKPIIEGQNEQGLYRVAINDGYVTETEALKVKEKYSTYWILEK